MMTRQLHNVCNSPLKGATPADGSMTLQLTRLLSRFLAVGVLTSPCDSSNSACGQCNGSEYYLWLCWTILFDRNHLDTCELWTPKIIYYLWVKFNNWKYWLENILKQFVWWQSEVLRSCWDACNESETCVPVVRVVTCNMLPIVNPNLWWITHNNWDCTLCHFHWGSSS